MFIEYYWKEFTACTEPQCLHKGALHLYWNETITDGEMDGAFIGP